MKEETLNAAVRVTYTDYDYDLAIRLYTQEIELSGRHNHAAWNNRGHCRVMKGLMERSQEMIDSGISDLEMAQRVAREHTGNEYPPANANIEWARELVVA